ncbi:MAG TPA: FG-GAP-like repeat-containing protein [Blastocatellia bacterium]|nr:FG-GAP-like repeat-containing protein [Blastocatellia bacterium]
MRSTPLFACVAASLAVSLVALAGINETPTPGLNNFATAVSFPVGAAPEALAVGDFNGDGRSDIAVANFDSDNVTVLLGLGNGTFLGAGNHPSICFSPVTVATGDFNNDNKLDIAAADGRCGSGNLYRGFGNGMFQPSIGFPAGFCPQAIIAGDFNRDGNLDIAVANAEGCLAAPTKENPKAPTSMPSSVSITLGNGNGTFQSLVSYSINFGPSDLVSGDFNRDTILDIAVTAAGSNAVAILLGNGNGTFRPPTPFAVGARPFSITKGDFNIDGKLDLAVANFNSANVSVLFGNGDGTFQPANSYAAGPGPNSITAADVAGDSNLDIVTANVNGNNISVLIGAAGGTFQPPINYTAGNTPTAVVSGNFNGDNKVDLAATNRWSNNVSILINCPGTVTFAQPIQFFPMEGGAGGVNVTGASACDWTAVSNDDWIVVTSPETGTGNGRIDFQVRENFTGGARQGSLSVGDSSFTLIQNGGSGEGCNYSISPTSQAYTTSAASGTINVTAAANCAWQAVSDSSWIEFTSVNYGIGNGAVSYFVAANSGAARKGKITIAGKTFSIKQKGQ